MPKQRLMGDRDRIVTSVLRELKFPLVFFGLALLVTEGTFGFVIVQGHLDHQTNLVFGSFMFVIFLVTILAVGWLTLLAPHHLMLLPQNRLETDRLAKMTKNLRSVSFERAPDETLADNKRRVEAALEEVHRALKMDTEIEITEEDL